MDQGSVEVGKHNALMQQRMYYALYQSQSQEGFSE